LQQHSTCRNCPSAILTTKPSLPSCMNELRIIFASLSITSRSLSTLLIRIFNEENRKSHLIPFSILPLNALALYLACFSVNNRFSYIWPCFITTSYLHFYPIFYEVFLSFINEAFISIELLIS
jgi:hypothetical protein